MKILHVGSRQFWESLWELLRELRASYCFSREMPFREWNFARKCAISNFFGWLLAERIFCGFLVLGRRIFSRILSSDFFSSFLWEEVPRKILQENPRQNPPKFIQQKSPTHFSCRGAVPKFLDKKIGGAARVRSRGSRQILFMLGFFAQYLKCFRDRQPA